VVERRKAEQTPAQAYADTIREKALAEKVATSRSRSSGLGKKADFELRAQIVSGRDPGGQPEPPIRAGRCHRGASCRVLVYPSNLAVPLPSTLTYRVTVRLS
jgi:hypothetical protein